MGTDSILDKRRPCQASWPDLSPLIQEALKLGFVIKSVDKRQDKSTQEYSTKLPLPQGYQFFNDSLREEEARVLHWLIHHYKNNCWFMTLTFKDYTHPDKADRMLRSFLARLSQAYETIPGAALLKSVYSVEWQQREVIHYHLLIYGDKLGSLSRKRWEFHWRMLSGGFAACYDAEFKAAPYLAKHQIKDRPGGNLHLGGAWRGITPPRSLACESDSNSVPGFERTTEREVESIASNGIWGVAIASHQASVATAQVNSCQV